MYPVCQEFSPSLTFIS